MLAQNNDDGKEVALYYLSQMLMGAEHNYKPVEIEHSYKPVENECSYAHSTKTPTLFTIKYDIFSVPNQST